MLVAAITNLVATEAQGTSGPAPNYENISIPPPVYAQAVDGAGPEARFSNPQGLAFDAKGNLYVADTGDHIIRKVTPSGQVTTIAGSSGQRGTVDGAGSNARFSLPNAIAVDKQGNLYVADSFNETIRKISPDGKVTTIAGMAGQPGITDGIGVNAKFDFPRGLAIDLNGTLFVTAENAIRKITPDGVVSTLAGNSAHYRPGTKEEADQVGSRDGLGVQARFDSPAGITIDKDGNLYVADEGNDMIRKVTPDGNVSTIAGAPPNLALRREGSVDGRGLDARFFVPDSVAIDSSRNLYVADRNSHTIRKIAPSGEITTIAGAAGQPGSEDGVGASARFVLPSGLAIDANDNIFVSDSADCTIRKISKDGVVTTFAGKSWYLTEHNLRPQ
ncbi:MAG: NHL repeat-containing protein [Nevskia sp.]|nr:NHL repeat-containing protein [Nevskia sp.]